MKTADLIAQLVADARPVRRLRPAGTRALLWLVLPALVFGLLALAHGTRADLAARLHEPDFVLALGASLSTGVLAAVASFMLNLPDRTRAWGLLPVPALLLWLASIGHACLANWVNLSTEGMQAGETARCFATVLITSLPLSLSIFAMLRNGAVLTPNPVTLTASLAVGAMSATAISLFHQLDASVLVLLWNFGLAGVLMAIGTFFGHRVLAGKTWILAS